MNKRLTERDAFGNADIVGVDSADLQLNLEFDEFNKVTDALNHLAAYEDSGLEPDETRPVVHSEWMGWTTKAYIGRDENNEPKYADRKYFRCRKCRYGSIVGTNFCPYCGADMRGT